MPPSTENKASSPKDSPSPPATEPHFDATDFLAHCSQRTGIYQMYDSKGNILYVGKAKDLKKRLSSYFQRQSSNRKTAALVKKIARIQITLADSEADALILENNLIKAERPPYNILLRDDKSYPYIHLSQHEHPRLSFHRGSKRERGRYFGPFPSSHAVRETLQLLQKVFKVRQCEDSFFNNRSRPCLQYQIGRCSAPCVGQVETTDYAAEVRQSALFLEGKNARLDRELSQAMDNAAAALDFEKAAEKRDQIQNLRKIQQQSIDSQRSANIDIIAAAIDSGQACLQVLYMRHGRILGSRSHYPKLGLIETREELLTAFISQNYLAAEQKNDWPQEIIAALNDEDSANLTTALSRIAPKKIKLQNRVRGGRARWLKMANDTAQQNLSEKLHSRQQTHHRFEQLQHDLALDNLPQRIECFDISHSSGENTVASCGAFDREGARKNDYRRFNINDITGGDDYAAMRKALQRRYTRLKTDGAILPDILLIDGGRGQLTQAQSVLEQLQIDEILIIGIAKGSSRKAGLETLFIDRDQRAASLPSNAASLHLLQQIRDEAHRFAISGHRARRGKKSQRSSLEQIVGVGPKRRRELLRHFGGQKSIAQASIEQLRKVPGINKKIAEDIYAALHNA